MVQDGQVELWSVWIAKGTTEESQSAKSELHQQEVKNTYISLQRVNSKERPKPSK